MPLLYEKREQIGILTLSRPEARNAWHQEFASGLQTCLPEIEEDHEIRCVILTGDQQGGAFSAGADLKNPRTHSEKSIADFIETLPQRRRSSPIVSVANFAKPIVAAVNGFAIGIGCILTLCCDLIVASERAEWRLPQASLGILPAQGGTLRAARWIGKGLAMRLALGFPLSADQAYRVGLAQWLVPHDELMTEAMRVAGHIAALPPLAVRLVKESLNTGMNMPLDEAAHADLYRFMALQLTEDKSEGHRAWRERRKPVFKVR
jgi:enoyl-CoA hydratase/carnithine racemase